MESGLRRQHGLLRHRRASGYYDLDNRTRISVAHSQNSTKFLGALAHATDPNPDLVRSQICHGLGDSFSVVTHLYDDFALPLQNAYPAFLRSRSGGIHS